MEIELYCEKCTVIMFRYDAYTCIIIIIIIIIIIYLNISSNGQDNFIRDIAKFGLSEFALSKFDKYCMKPSILIKQ